MTTIADDAFTGCGPFSIITTKGSEAQRYANEHQIPVIVR